MENGSGFLDDRHHWLVDKLVETFKLKDRALAENFIKYVINLPALIITIHYLKQTD